MGKQKFPAATLVGAEQSGTVTPFPTRRILELVQPKPNHDTIELLTELLSLAQAGAVAGLAVVALYAPGKMDKKFGVSLAGLAKTNPTMAVGAMDTCTMLVKEIALRDAGIS